MVLEDFWNYLSVKGELVQFEVFEETAFNSASLVYHSLALLVPGDRLPDDLLGLSQVVFHIQFGIPVLIPVYVVYCLLVLLEYQNARFNMNCFIY
jgi:hypothetical protein